jgi:hypothetical protein
MRLHLDTLDIKDDLAMMMIGRPRRPRPSIWIWKVPRNPHVWNPRRSGLAVQRGPLLSVSVSALLYPPRGFWRLATKARRARRKPPPATRNPLTVSSPPMSGPRPAAAPNPSSPAPSQPPPPPPASAPARMAASRVREEGEVSSGPSDDEVRTPVQVAAHALLGSSCPTRGFRALAEVGVASAACCFALVAVAGI